MPGVWYEWYTGTVQEDCRNLIELTTGAPTIEEQKAWFTKDADGKSKLQKNLIGDLMTFFVDQSIYSQEEKDKVISDECYDRSLLPMQLQSNRNHVKRPVRAIVRWPSALVGRRLM